jgi:hypothetical protein
MLTPIKEYAIKHGMRLREVYRAVDRGTLKMDILPKVIVSTRTQKIKCIVED